MPRKDFIRLGAAVGLGVAGSSVLVACGGGGGSAQDGGKKTKKKEEKGDGGASTTSPSVKAGDPIVDAGFIPAGFAFSFDLAETGEPAVLVHLPDGVGQPTRRCVRTRAARWDTSSRAGGPAAPATARSLTQPKAVL